MEAVARNKNDTAWMGGVIAGEDCLKAQVDEPVPLFNWHVAVRPADLCIIIIAHKMYNPCLWLAYTF
jgi:hypothetical protein